MLITRLSIKTQSREKFVYSIVSSSNPRYWFKNKVFAKRLQCTSIKNTLHRQSEKACMCFKMRCVRTRHFTVFIVTEDSWSHLMNSYILKLNSWKKVFFPHPFICQRSFSDEKVGDQKSKPTFIISVLKVNTRWS